MKDLEIIKLLKNAATACVTTREYDLMLSSVGAELMDNSGARAMYRIDNYLLKVSRSDVRGWDGRKYLAYENTSECAVWSYARTLPPESRDLLNPVLHLTPDNRILVMRYLEPITLDSNSIPDFSYYARELSRVHGLTEVSPWSTSVDYKQIHYPYVHHFPFINKPSIHD